MNGLEKELYSKSKTSLMLEEAIKKFREKIAERECEYDNIKRRIFHTKEFLLKNRNDLDEINRWKERFRDQSSHGAGQVRENSRSDIFLNVSSIIEKLENWKELVNDQMEIPVIVIASLGGGTGSGAFLDVLALVYDTFKEFDTKLQVRFFPVFPSYYYGTDKKGDETIQSLNANAYAALKELDFFLSGNKFQAKYPVIKDGGVTIKEVDFSFTELFPFRELYTGGIYLTGSQNCFQEKILRDTEICRLIAYVVSELVFPQNRSFQKPLFLRGLLNTIECNKNMNMAHSGMGIGRYGQKFVRRRCYSSIGYGELSFSEDCYRYFIMRFKQEWLLDITGRQSKAPKDVDEKNHREFIEIIEQIKVGESFAGQFDFSGPSVLDKPYEEFCVDEGAGPKGKGIAVSLLRFTKDNLPDQFERCFQNKVVDSLLEGMFQLLPNIKVSNGVYPENPSEGEKEDADEKRKEFLEPVNHYLRQLLGRHGDLYFRVFLDRTVKRLEKELPKNDEYKNLNNELKEGVDDIFTESKLIRTLKDDKERSWGLLNYIKYKFGNYEDEYNVLLSNVKSFFVGTFIPHLRDGLNFEIRKYLLEYLNAYAENIKSIVEKAKCFSNEVDSDINTIKENIDTCFMGTGAIVKEYPVARSKPPKNDSKPEQDQKDPGKKHLETFNLQGKIDIIDTKEARETPLIHNLEEKESPEEEIKMISDNLECLFGWIQSHWGHLVVGDWKEDFLSCFIPEIGGQPRKEIRQREDFKKMIKELKKTSLLPYHTPETMFFMGPYEKDMVGELKNFVISINDLWQLEGVQENKKKKIVNEMFSSLMIQSTPYLRPKGGWRELKEKGNLHDNKLLIRCGSGIPKPEEFLGNLFLSSGRFSESITKSDNLLICKSEESGNPKNPSGRETVCFHLASGFRLCDLEDVHELYEDYLDLLYNIRLGDSPIHVFNGKGFNGPAMPDPINAVNDLPGPKEDPKVKLEIIKELKKDPTHPTYTTSAVKDELEKMLQRQLDPDDNHSWHEEDIRLIKNFYHELVKKYFEELKNVHSDRIEEELIKFNLSGSRWFSVICDVRLLAFHHKIRLDHLDRNNKLFFDPKKWEKGCKPFGDY